MRGETGGARASLDTSVPDDVPPSTAVVEAVAEVTNDRPEDLPPLYDVVDPDALDGIIGRGTDGVVAFRYVGCLVNVDADGSVRIFEAD